MIQENKDSNTTNFFSIWKESIDSYYAGLEKTIPQYLQSMTNLYQEYSKTWNAALDSFIGIEEEIVSKGGMKLELPTSAIKTSNEANREIQKAIDFQNKVTIASIDSSCRGLKTYHDNIDSLANLNRAIVENLVPNLSRATTK